jgi:YegS/Rv2252/BmrU family lipid kinase
MNGRELPLIIVNPRSGRGISQQQWASSAVVIRDHFGPFECRFTQDSGDAAKIAEEEAKNGRRLLIAMGGDGTISEVANGLLRSGMDSVLGILPAGTGSDFRRTLGISSDLHRAAKNLKAADTRRMDVGHLVFVNHSGRPEERYFVNMASFGMSGKVAMRANRSTKLLGGGFTYAAATLSTLLSYTRPEVILSIDEQEALRLRILTVCVANGPTFGGGMRIAPDAKLNDGLFDVTMIGAMKTMQILLQSHRLYSGDLRGLEKVAMRRARKLKAQPAENGSEVLLEVDGETPGRLPASFEILPAALRIRF